MIASTHQPTDLTLPTGYRARPATMSDVAAAAALFNRCSDKMFGEPEFTEQSLAVEWETPEFDLARDTRLTFDAEGTLVGYVEMWPGGEVPVHPWCWARTDPDHEGRGLGSAFLAWAEDEARARVLPRAPEGARVSLLSGTVAGFQPAEALLSGYGMEPVRHFWRMVRELDGPIEEVAFPEGVALRPFERERDGLAAFRAIGEAFRDHWGYVEVPEEKGFTQWSHWAFHENNFDPSLWFVAWDGDEIAGVSRCRAHTDADAAMGWVSQLAVRRPWRKLGLGRALLLHSFRLLQARGKARVGLGVDASSPTGATRLYEAAGMHVARQFINYEKELRAGREISTQG